VTIENRGDRTITSEDENKDTTIGVGSRGIR